MSFAATARDLRETDYLADGLADLLAPGDLVLLQGGLGAGKTTFARALLRRLARDPALEVPSPTFTLAQDYELGTFPVLHVDLYRLQRPEEARELGLDEAVERGACLVEWPERGAPFLPRAATLQVQLEAVPGQAEARRLVFEGDEAWSARLGNLSARLREGAASRGL